MHLSQIMHVTLALSLALLHSSITAHATTVLELTFPEVVVQAETIVVGTVTRIHEQWDATQHVPLTQVTFTNLTVLKGNPGNSMTLEFLGGTMPNGIVMVIPGVPRFTVGEKTVVFRARNLREFCPVVGVWQGLLRVVKDPQTNEETVSDNFRRPIMGIRDGTLVRRSPSTLRQKGLSLPVLVQSIQRLLLQPTP